MKRRYKAWSKRVMQWLLRQLHRLFAKPDRIFQSISGDRNQAIAQMSGGTAIASVEQLIQHFHLSPKEILSLKHFWENWSQETDPPFSPSLVIGGRDQKRENIFSWLRGSPSSFSLQGDSPEEAIAFLAAVVQSLEDEERSKILSRAVIVDSITSWQNLITSSNPLILIPRLEQPEGIGRATQRGHHVFVPLGRVSSDRSNLLPRIVRDTAEQALKEMGLSNDEARCFATLARRSLSALRRKLAIAQNIQQPAWAKPREVRVLLAPLLVSAWNGACKGDRSALAKLSGLPYETFQDHLVRWANEPDPPLRRVGDIWMIAAQEDAWRLMARYLTDDDFNRFEAVALDVLSELNPALELPPEQRLMAAIYKKGFRHSDYLRKGISETLALMATLSSEVSFIANPPGEEVVNKIVWRLVEKAKDSASLWASLAYLLPLLAEAAPEIFLDAIDADLTREHPLLVSLFQDNPSSSGWMGSSPHTGLLWALETLAWNPDYLSQAALNLARLSRLDPGGRFANRPANSLRDIFFCWHPNTTASLPSCLKVLDTIRRHEPKVAWSLLMSLLPELRSTVSRTHGTKWRDWVPNSRTPITNDQEYREVTNAILERLIADADGSITRWCELIVSARGLYVHQQDMLLHALEALDPKQFTSEERVQICDRLRKETIDHREYADAKWAMPTNQVLRLEAVLSRFEPDSLIDRHRWLFKSGVELPGKRKISWQEKERIAENSRTKVLKEILTSQGWDGVIQLVQRVKEPGLVGVTLAKAKLLPIDLGLFLQENFLSPDQCRSALARSYISFNAYNQGEQWIEDCLSPNLPTWSAEEYGEFLLYLPFTSYLLERLDTAPSETQHYFWSRVQHIDFLGTDDANRILTDLLKFGRFHLALMTIELNLNEASEWFSPDRIADVLEASVQTRPEQNFDYSSFVYNSAELMNYLEKTHLSRDRLAMLELMYFRIHEHYRRPRILYDELSKQPELFVKFLQYIFPAENESTIEETDEKNRSDFSMWKFAFDFFEGWKQMPGVLDDGSVDAEALRSWVIRVRELADECNLGKDADDYIGRFLAFSPADPDGAWPHQAVRNLLEELANPAIEDSWSVQISNNRGVTTRLLTEGGEQERVLIEKYKEWNRKIRDQWPRTAAVLRARANSYRQQASEQDVRAELTQDFWR